MKAFRKIILLIPAVILLYPAISLAAAGEKLTVKGYYFDLSSDQTGNNFRAWGIISGGESCKKLVVTIHFHNEINNSTSITIIVNNYGGYESFSTNHNVNVSRTSRWLVSKIYIEKYH